MSKNLILAFILCFSTFASAKDLIIVSDLDETLRMANVEVKILAGLKLIEGVKPYPGLVNIFQELKKNNTNVKFYYLSNSFPFLYVGKRWVSKYKLPDGVVLQRSLGDKQATFKPKMLDMIYKAHPGADFMLFGDNVEHDPKFYQDFVARNAVNRADIYIRDARLTFPQSSKITYFQTDAQITDDLYISTATSESINKLPFSKLVPNFLLRNLKNRLMKECKTSFFQCEAAANLRVNQVVERIRP